MLNVHTKCQKYRQQAEGRYRRATCGIFHGDRRYKAQGQSPKATRLPTSSPREVHGWTIPLEIDADESELVRRPAGRGRAGSLWHGHLNHRATPKPVIITRPCLPWDLRVRARTQTEVCCRARVRERVPGSAHYQTAWSSGSQGTHVKGVEPRGCADSLITSLSQYTRTHPRHCVLRGSATPEEEEVKAIPSFAGRFNRPMTVDLG